MLGGLTTVINTTNVCPSSRFEVNTYLLAYTTQGEKHNSELVCLINDVCIAKYYTFPPTVAIIRFYPKLCSKKRECLYNVRHRVSMLRSHHLRVRQS